MPIGQLNMRIPAGLLLVLATAACQPAGSPDQGRGYEGADYSSYMRGRETASAGQGFAAPQANAGFQANAAPPAQFSTEAIGSAIDAAAQPAPSPGSLYTPPAAAAAPASSYAAADPGLPGTRPRGNAPAGIKEETGEMAAINGGHSAISDENDFKAVSARRSRESDAQFIAQNRANYTVIPPQPVPQRTGAEGPNIVQYALSTTNNPGVSLYKRSSLRLSSPEAVCARFGSPDLAQAAFLAAGGPERDRKGMDPDGDGFACGWDPRPFRKLR